MFMFEAQPLDLPAEAFPRPHLLIMKQYLSSSFSWEEILSRSCLWTPLVSVINGFPITHCSCLPLCQMPPTPPLFLIPAVLGLWGWVFPSLHAASAIFVPQTQLIYFSRQDIGHTHSWESWPGAGIGISLATKEAVVSLAVFHECWWLLRYLLIKTWWWGIKFAALRVLSMSDLEWTGTFHSEHQ